ncbi:MAG: 30S ribosomal protein S17 [Candidatus Levybacteria bacterium RIFCSPHIGHO2_01_FULL_40_15b]|nr:MAG: 30S ribosomal protein S17 [Candidatus Levybacteria bacterium RIFCSPHIGHO2_01_FULL_40_15b]
MQKTLVVQVERRTQHPVYKKILKRTTKIKADTNNFEVSIGQNVKIEQTRPLSRDKHFKVIEVMKGETRD